MKNIPLGAEAKLMEDYKNDIVTGERVKILFEIIMEELGMTYDNTMSDVMKEMAESVKKYYDSTEALGKLMHEKQKRQLEDSTEEDVSVSNY